MWCACFFRAHFSELTFQSSVLQSSISRSQFLNVMCLLFRWLWTREPRMMFRFMFALTNGVRSTKEISFKWKSYQRYMNTCMRDRSISAWVLMDFFFLLSTISAHYLCLTLNSNNLKWYVSVEWALFPFDIIKIINNMIYCFALHIFIVVFLDFCDFRRRISVSLGLFILFFLFCLCFYWIDATC